MNVLVTLDHYKPAYSLLQIFTKFVNRELEECDLSCFLFLRSLAEKELNSNIFSKHRKTICSLETKFISKKQANHIMKNFLGDNPNVNHETFINRFLQDRKNAQKISAKTEKFNENAIRPYELFLYSLTEYKKFRDQLKQQEVSSKPKTNHSGTSFTGNYIDTCFYQTFSPENDEAVKSALDRKSERSGDKSLGGEQTGMSGYQSRNSNCSGGWRGSGREGPLDSLGGGVGSLDENFNIMGSQTNFSSYNNCENLPLGFKSSNGANIFNNQ